MKKTLVLLALLSSSLFATVTITSPTAGATLSGSVTFSASTTGTVATVDYWMAGHSVVTQSLPTTAPYSKSVDTKALWDGPTQIVAISRDSHGKILEQSAPVSVTINNLGLTAVVLNSPNPAVTQSGTITWSVTATDARNLTAFIFYVDGKQVANIGMGGPVTTYTATYSLDTTTLINGTHALFCEIVPANGLSYPQAQSSAQITTSNGAIALELRSNYRELYFAPGSTAPVTLVPKMFFTDATSTAAVSPAYSSSNAAIASVGASSGIVTPGATQGIATVTITSAGKTATVRVTNINTHAGFSHFTKSGQIVNTFNSATSTWVRTMFFTGGNAVTTVPSLVTQFHSAAVNTITSGYYFNPVDQAWGVYPDLATWKAAVGPSLQGYLDGAKNNGFQFLATGDDVERSAAEMDATLNRMISAGPNAGHTFSWDNADAVRFCVAKLIASGNVIGIEGEDEIGGATVPPDWRSVMAIYNSAPSRPPITWPPAGGNGSTNVAAWMGDPTMSEYASFYWVYLSAFRLAFPWGASVTQTKDAFDTQIVGLIPYAQIDKPKLMEVTGASGPMYTKQAAGDNYQPGVDIPQVQGHSIEDLSAEIMYAAAIGMAGVRVYGYDGNAPTTDGLWDYTRHVASVGTTDLQTGASPVSSDQGVKDRWTTMSNALNVVQTIEPYLLSSQIHALDLGRDIVTGARQLDLNQGRMLMAVNMSDNARTLDVDLSPYRYASASSGMRYRVVGLLSANESTTIGVSETVTMAPGEAVVWVFTPGGGTPAPTKATVTQVTATQAIVKVTTGQPGYCTYTVSETLGGSPVNDVNPALFAGADSDAREPYLVTGPEHTFTAGARRSDQAADKKFYSRALAANTKHFGTVACGTDSAVPFTFTTGNIAMGDTFMDPIQFDSNGLGNYAIPSVDFTDLTKAYVDPQTGFKFKVITGPGQMPEYSKLLSSATGEGHIPGSSSGANWTSPASGLAVDGTFASYTASGQDALTIRLPGQCPFGTCTVNGWHNSLGNASGYYVTNIDSYQVSLTGDGNGSTIDVDVALSWNGVAPGTEWKTITLPASTGPVKFPTDLFQGLAAWQGVNYPNIPAMYWQTVQNTATVSTSGTVVTFAGDVNYGAFSFPLDPRVFTAGSKITINGGDYTVASVDSATQLTLTSSAGTQSNVTAFISNFSVMVRKHSATGGTLRVDGASVTLPLSNSFKNGNSGFQQYCSPQTSTDAQGKVGRFCIFQSHQGESGIFWVTNTLEARFIGRAYLPPSAIGVSQDEYLGSFYTGQSLFDTASANSWWIGTTLVSNGRTTLVKATYNPSGVGGCSQTANYQKLPPNATYDSGSVDNCNIVYQEMTTPSTGKDLFTAISANPNGSHVNSGKFTTPALSFVQNGYAVMYANTGGQDTETWIITVKLSDLSIKGIFSTYMNQGKASCRACVLHGVGPSTATDDWFYMIFNDYAQGSGYQMSVNTALTNTPTIDKTTCAAQVTDSAVAWMVPYSDGCDQITFAGSDNIPCTHVPTAWDTGNAPACTWNGAGWTQWEAGQVKIGDHFIDASVGYEEMVLGKNVSGSTWILLRNVNIPQQASMTGKPGVTPGYLRAHSGGWNGWLYCTYQQNAFVRLSAETDGSTMVHDAKFEQFNHSVMRPGGIISAEYYADIDDYGQSVRVGAFPGSANTAETARVLNTAPFAGKVGLGGLKNVQSHIGWDGVSSWFTDMAPIAPVGGGAFYLWIQSGITNVTGSLYKIPATSAYIPHARKQRASAVWAGMYNFQDVSGLGTITGGQGDNFKYCVIDYAGATCGQAGEAVGDLYMNVPQVTLDGRAGGIFDLNRPSATPLGQEPMALLQYFFPKLGTSSLHNEGRFERRLTNGLARYNGQDTYSNAKMLDTSGVVLFSCSAPNMQRVGELCAGSMPPISESVDNRGTYIKRSIKVGSGSTGDTVRLMIGYAEFGSPLNGYCTTRQESCYTTNTPSDTTPWLWAGETQNPTPCASGCSIDLPILPSHTAYYRVCRKNAAGAETCTLPQPLAAP